MLDILALGRPMARQSAPVFFLVFRLCQGLLSADCFDAYNPFAVDGLCIQLACTACPEEKSGWPTSRWCRLIALTPFLWKHVPRNLL